MRITVPDNTYAECLSVQKLCLNMQEEILLLSTVLVQEGKAGVLNDALVMATGEYICVYDADAMPEKMLFISL